VSVDCTFGITRYGYAVFTITGMDSAFRGVPLAFAILSGEAEEDFVAALQAWRDRARKQRPGFQPSVFLTDDSQAEQNAITYATMPRCISVLTHTTLEQCVLQRLKYVAHDICMHECTANTWWAADEIVMDRCFFSCALSTLLKGGV
jgi:hypothetical protein